MGTFIDLNADIGEGCGTDAALLPFVSSASIACGGHAGDATSMRAALRLCRLHGVAAGAHPSFVDRTHFGRRALPWQPQALFDALCQQVRTLQELAAQEGVPLRHLKPHGALYNLAAGDPALAELVAQVALRCDPALAVFGLSGSELPNAATRLGLHAVHEAFADRGYAGDGTLLPRDQAGALLLEPQAALEQVLGALRTGRVQAPGGPAHSVRADSFCLHGDTPGAVERARLLAQGLQAAGFRLRAPGD